MSASDDAVELAIKLEWAQRQLEEKSALVDTLRRHVNQLAEENVALGQHVVRLKEAQTGLLADKMAAEERAERALAEKADLASENARLHAYAREAGAKAEAATAVSRELQSMAAIAAQAETAALTALGPRLGGGGDGGSGEGETVAGATGNGLPMHTIPYLTIITRLLLLLAHHNVPVQPGDLLLPPGAHVRRAMTNLAAASGRSVTVKPHVRGEEVPALRHVLVQVLGALDGSDTEGVPPAPTAPHHPSETAHSPPLPSPAVPAPAAAITSTPVAAGGEEARGQGPQTAPAGLGVLDPLIKPLGTLSQGLWNILVGDVDALPHMVPSPTKTAASPPLHREVGVDGATTKPDAVVVMPDMPSTAPHPATNVSSGDGAIDAAQA